MGNLIRSHLARLVKTPVFWLALLAMIPYGLALYGSADSEFAHGNTSGSSLWGQIVCGFGLLIGIVLAAVFSLFFDAEYAEGTVRNKLVAGHGRVSVYLATLVTGLLAALALYLAYLLSWLPYLPWMLQNFPAPETKALVLSLAGTMLNIMAACSVCVLFCTLVQKRSVLAVTLILLMAGVFAVSIQVLDAYQSATAGGMQMMLDEAGRRQFVFHESGQAGPFLTFLYDFLPICQTYRYMELDAAPVMPAYSAALAALAAGLGLALFKRKDIK